jgi:hypothetical protein
VRDFNYDNEKLVHEKTPSGMFYARIVNNKSTDTQDVAGVFRVGTQNITIETCDSVSINKDDIVQFDNEIWIVGRVTSYAIQKNAEYSSRYSKQTTIELNRGK